jgi:uncharacterized protein with FMN-binding domain
MRRAAPILLATAAGMAMLASFHTTPGANLGLAAADPAATATTASPPTTARRSTTTAAPRTIDGPSVSTRFGNVQVRATVQGTRILDVVPLQLPSSHPKSTYISQQAAPLLRNEVLQAQSAHINLISGASYTSQGYAESLQGALDRSAVV